MSNLDQSARHSIVELAMARSSSQKAKPDLSTPQPGMVERSLGRHSHDEALPYCVSPTRSAFREEKPPSPAFSEKDKPGPVVPHRTESNHFLRIASHLISAAAGAAVMWSVIDEPVRTPIAAPPATTVAEATIVPSASKNSPITPPAVVSVDTQVRDMLERWRQSWSDRAVDSYLGFYSAHFVPADGTQRSVWAEGRRNNFLSRSAIHVWLHNVVVTPIDSQQVKVSLLQDYASGSYKETRQPKTFLLAREGTDWRIVGEWQGDHSPLPATQE